MMSNSKRFVCIDVGYGDDWYITDNGKRLSEIEIVDLLNEKQSTIQSLEEENKRLRKKIFNGLFDNCTLENENDISHLQYVFALCKLLVDDAMEEVENENIEYAVELAEECIYQFESRMKHFNPDKHGEKRVLLDE